MAQFLSSELDITFLTDRELNPPTPVFCPPLAVNTCVTPARSSMRLSQADSGFGSTDWNSDDSDYDYTSQLSPAACSSDSLVPDSVRRALPFEVSTVGIEMSPLINKVALAAGKVPVHAAFSAVLTKLALTDHACSISSLWLSCFDQLLRVVSEPVFSTVVFSGT